MTDENQGTLKAMKVESICFLCTHARIMGIEIESPGVHPLTLHSGMNVRQVAQTVCHARGGATPLGSNCSVKMCSDFEQQIEPRELKVPLVPGTATGDSGPTPSVFN
jgi:hypothetical protein